MAIPPAPLPASMSIPPCSLTRRELLCRSGAGFGALALGGMLAAETQASAGTLRASIASPMASRPPQFPAKAKHVIHIFLNGGPSHVDTFDYKPALAKFAGKSLPTGNLQTERKTGSAFPSPFRFRKYGKSGIEVSDIFSHLGECVDDIAFVHSMHANVPNHEASLMLMNCGAIRTSRPSTGSWITYGLGTENQNLPGFIAMCPGGYPLAGTDNWRSAFLPGTFQATYINSKHQKIEKLIQYIRNDQLTLSQQRDQLNLLQTLNRRHADQRNGDSQLEARIQSFELAYRMQTEAAEVFDLSHEPKHVLDMYGPGVHARQLLTARRLVERGVRYVQLWHGAGQPWDNHRNLEKQLTKLGQQCDQPIAALLKDLKQRGLLDETIVMCGGEFGRTPVVELKQTGTSGRDHNHYGFTVWLAGGGVKGGQVYGSTDEFGFRAVENPVHVHDLHATLLKLLGFDHKQLTYRFAGRDYRLTDVAGHVVDDLIA